MIIILVLSGAILVLLILISFCAIKRKCVAKKTHEEPIYDNVDIKPAYHEEIPVEENDALLCDTVAYLEYRER